ncbi:hypothetical protein [Streptomyces sp. NPDC048057]|uniref:hypothetical protein n=1 Tax=Streptomyces sp. NPDC048057 TaxID=3155628 RepID=UPI0034084BA9
MTTICRCDDGADPYECEAEGCTYEFSELNPRGGTRPIYGSDAKISRTCPQCPYRTSVWHVDDGSADEELYRHQRAEHPTTTTTTGGPR